MSLSKTKAPPSTRFPPQLKNASKRFILVSAA
jgi:hypothetical protein